MKNKTMKLLILPIFFLLLSQNILVAGTDPFSGLLQIVQDSAQFFQTMGISPTIESERKKYPKDTPIVLYFRTIIQYDQTALSWNLVSFRFQSSQVCYSLNLLPPDSPYSDWEYKNIPLSKIKGLYQRGSDTNHYYKDFIWPHWTKGSGTPIEEIKDKTNKVDIKLIPSSQEVKLCSHGFLTLQATTKIDNKIRSITISTEKVSWSFPNGLEKITPATSVPTIAVANSGYSLSFLAKKEGTYQVQATLGGTSTYHATVIVPPPTVKEIIIKGPDNWILESGNTAQFDAHAVFEENCVKPRLVTDKVIWESKSGSNVNNIYTAPKPKASSIKISCTSHPNLTADLCDNVSFSAQASFMTMGDSMTAKYDNKSSNPFWLLIKAPEAEDVTNDPAVMWSAGSPSFQLKQRQSLAVTGTMESVGSDTVTLNVNPVTIERIEVTPTTVEMDMGEVVHFAAKAYYKQQCIKPEDITGEAFGSSGASYEATDPGQFTKDAEYGGVRSQASITVRQPHLVVSPSRIIVKLNDPPIHFTATLETNFTLYKKPTDAELTWTGGSNVFIPSRCGTFEKTATYITTGQSVTAIIEVNVNPGDCVAIRKALADMNSSNIDPDKKKQSIKWLQVREDLLSKGCDCGVQPGWIDSSDADKGSDDQNSTDDSFDPNDDPSLQCSDDGDCPAGHKCIGYKCLPNDQVDTINNTISQNRGDRQNQDQDDQDNNDSGSIGGGEIKDLPTSYTTRTIGASTSSAPGNKPDQQQTATAGQTGDKGTTDGQYPTATSGETGGDGQQQAGVSYVVVCNKGDGKMVVTKKLSAKNHLPISEAGSFSSREDAIQWVNQSCPSWRCDKATGACDSNSSPPDSGDKGTGAYSSGDVTSFGGVAWQKVNCSLGGPNICWGSGGRTLADADGDGRIDILLSGSLHWKNVGGNASPNFSPPPKNQ